MSCGRKWSGVECSTIMIIEIIVQMTWRCGGEGVREVGREGGNGEYWMGMGELGVRRHWKRVDGHI